MNHCIPNEINAIEYRKVLGHSLVSHVDDRQKHKEPIANLSLAGDCYMTYTNVKDQTVRAKKVLLPRRTLQVLTGRARYDYAHGIANADLLSDRRVSLTMRETIGAGHCVGR
jgi:alkylated DNA repair dioxygenase AlkB